MNKKEFLIYGIIAIIIVAAVASALIFTTINKTYSVKVTLETNSTLNVYPYQESGFRIYINNTGGSGISQMPLTFYLNGNPLQSYSVTLPAGVGTYIPANYIYPSNGTFEFSAIADPGHVFQISNRNLAQSSIIINVSSQERPSPYTSIPNSNVTSTQATYLIGGGVTLAYELGSGYNISTINNIFGPTKSIITKILQDLSPEIASVSSSIVYYPSNSIGYSAWIDGTINPYQAGAVTSSFGFKQSAIEINGTPVILSKISNTTSMCIYYSKGWTKIISYYNNTLNETCATIAATSYEDLQSNTIVSMLNSTPRMLNITNKFRYSNSTYYGQIFSYAKNRNFSYSNVFANKYGSFISVLQRNIPAIKINSTEYTCYGLIYNSSNTSICSSFIYPVGSSGLSYGLLNQTMITSNYTATLLSFVNQSNLILANENGVILLNSLNISKRSTKWEGAFKNTCTLPNASINFQCSVVSFNQTTNKITLNITNNMHYSAKLNSISCVFSGETGESIINSTLKPGASIEASTTCYNIPVPISTATTTYNFIINYTANGQTKLDAGLLNLSNFIV